MITKQELQEIRDSLRGPDYYYPEHFVKRLLNEIEDLLPKKHFYSRFRSRGGPRILRSRKIKAD